MNKNEICALLACSGIAYELVDHPAVYTMEDLAALSLPHPEAEAKNLFLRDDKRNFLLLTVPGEKRVNLKACGSCPLALPKTWKPCWGCTPVP